LRAFLTLLVTSWTSHAQWCDSHRDKNCIAPSVTSARHGLPGFGRIFPRLRRQANSERREKCPTRDSTRSVDTQQASSLLGQLVKGALMSFIHLALRGAATRHLASSSLTRFSKSRIPQRMAFSAASALDKAQIETRILDIMKSFEKVHPEKV